MEQVSIADYKAAQITLARALLRNPKAVAGPQQNVKRGLSPSSAVCLECVNNSQIFRRFETIRPSGLPNTHQCGSCGVWFRPSRKALRRAARGFIGEVTVEAVDRNHRASLRASARGDRANVRFCQLTSSANEARHISPWKLTRGGWDHIASDTEGREFMGVWFMVPNRRHPDAPSAYSEERGYPRLDERKMRELRANTKNKYDLRQWVGIELEFAGGDEWTDATTDAISKAGLSVSLKGDGSVEGSSAPYQECTLQTRLDGGLVPTLNKVTTALVKAGCEVNRSTGLHVHLNCEMYEPAEVRRRYNRLWAVMPALAAITHKSRGGSSYCQFKRSRDDRYVAVNYTAFDAHKTIEIRMAAGSLNAAKIAAWARLLAVVFHGDTPIRRLPRKPKAMADWLTEIGKPELGKWYESRREALAGNSCYDTVARFRPRVRASRARVAAAVPFILNDAMLTGDSRE